MECLGKSWDARLGLATRATTTHTDIDIEHRRICRHRQWLQDQVALFWLVEILNERLAIDSDAACTGLDVSERNRCLPLAHAPGTAFRIQLWLTSLLGECPPEVKQVDPIELGEIVRGALQRLQTVKLVNAHLFCKLAQVSTHVMLVERILSHSVEQGNLLVLLIGEVADRVVT